MRLSFIRFISFTDKSGILTHDRIRLSIKAGNGANGLARYNGIGGNGGNVVFLPKSSLTFNNFLKKFANIEHVVKAENGVPSTVVNLIGKHGIDSILEVPVGVECINAENNILLVRCDKPNIRHTIAKGGWGGCAANNYQGRKGERFVLNLHLKIKANVGFLGFPNAGKSTLLKALVPKKPIKIAPYPFTTLKPQVCHYTYPTDNLIDYPFTLTFADLPGLIEGAHVNRGKGYEFLKHLEYSDIIAMIIDISGFYLSKNTSDIYRNPLECIAILNREMEKYDKKLLKKPIVLILNKIDLEDGEKISDEIINKITNDKWIEDIDESIRPNNIIKFVNIVKISAKNRNLGNFQDVIKNIYDDCHPIRTLEDIKFIDSETFKVL
uniref:OBG-type G domain-containing protein n=1 Tax=Parastrongyloides trichosuri TaxID=131310 RepID=A0A0N4ZUZ7_PARTI